MEKIKTINAGIFMGLLLIPMMFWTLYAIGILFGDSTFLEKTFAAIYLAFMLL